ncbi:hypothetical protein [Shewanella salipaludis]|uniref:Uncharacterized protein n=1 Tax=Shewanella salipaludis TaxID=2723052 RepID=A0A972JLC4_9GAMM|nr:hypothetical protein [Shewanella salipaludis]NMH65287.1 hypothetical protein [Shewanella salipaludis]
MINTNVKTILTRGLLLGSIGLGFGANAEVLQANELVSAVEQNMSEQAQEILTGAKRELTLSLRTQLAESIYDFNQNAEASKASEMPQSETLAVNAKQKD